MATTSSLSRNFPTLRYLAAPFRWFFRSRRRRADPGSRAARAARRAADLVEYPTGRPARHRRAVRSRGVPVARDPRRPQRLRALPRGGGSAQALGHLEPGARRQDRPACPLVAGPPGGPALGGGEPRGNGPVSQGDRAARALDPTSPSDAGSYKLVRDLYQFKTLALLEASRLEDRGDMGGAWGWYGAAPALDLPPGLARDDRRAAHGTASP